MSKLNKLKERISKKPKDFRYSEAKTLLNSLGFEEYNKGKTSGSRTRFYRKSDGKMILLHRPHPDDILKGYVVKELCDFLKGNGDI